MKKKQREFTPVAIAILTVSDTRDHQNDRSGQTLVELATEAGHTLVDRQLVEDNRYAIRAIVSSWIAAPSVQAIVLTGGTGFAERDVTPEAISVLLDQTIPGFGELFRQLSYPTIGSSTLQSRALAGVANGTLVAALPGSPGACRDGWNGILADQLDVRHAPCNLAEQLLGL
ncbi:MAG: molybdenum cofactor biosynthesis protein B [Spiribacter sp.]|jgi:molybdenum cofactor biosynthesis protein B|nr:molybdenum cofactor biosynthesis protein B [Spiribacter sp.]MDR9488879.1 molybdenum cofactor biosynthesis protein B [Spiribacter sp.]